MGVLMCPVETAMFSGHGQRPIIDSGAYTIVCPKTYAGSSSRDVDGDLGTELVTVTGSDIKTYGKREVVAVTTDISGNEYQETVNYTLADARKPIRA